MTISHLDFFKKNNIKVTFFFLAFELIKNKWVKVVNRAKNEGHVIASHNFHHSDILKDLKNKSNEEIIKYFSWSNLLFYRKTGIYPRFFRPPYGEIDEKLAKRITKLTGMKVILWNLDTMDWLHIRKGHNPNNILKAFDEGLDRGESSYISLQHDKKESDLKEDLKRLEKIIKKIKKKGYNFVTLDKCLNEKAYFD